MSMIEVDPKLFITCRLCLDEMGVYQIVPDVKTKIKYCFDIEVELLYGLPQLICRNCESKLSEYAKVKQNFQEKQSTLMLKYKGHGDGEIIKPQQDTVSSTQHSYAESQNNCIDEIVADRQIVAEKIPSSSRNPSLDTSFDVTSNNELETNTKTTNSSKKQWRKNYMKHFVCRFCSKSLKHKKNMVNHNQQCQLLKKYSSLLKGCSVHMHNINSNPNLTGLKDSVVVNKNKIVHTKRSNNYYVVYSLKSSRKSDLSESSDEDFIAKKKVHKRRRLLSQSSNETLIIAGNSKTKIENFMTSDNEENDQTFEKKNKKKKLHESDIECVNLDDSDNTSTSTCQIAKANPSVTAQTHNIEIVNRIITMCRAKYLKKIDGRSISKDSDDVHSFLQRKLLSIGRKVINKDGFNATGLLRYMEHNDLEVAWIPKLEANVAVKTTLKENKNTQKLEEDNIPWKSLSLLNDNTENKDFIDMFEKISKSRSNTNNTKDTYLNIPNTECQQNIKVNPIIVPTANQDKISHFFRNMSKYEKKVENNVLYLSTTPETENQNMLKKILNANPVANPKQLPKKTSHESTTVVGTNGATTDKTEVNNRVHVSDSASTSENNSESVLNVLPVITSTISLAPTYKRSNTSHDINSSTSNAEAVDITTHPPHSGNQPMIKVKPMSELMPETSIQPKGVPVSSSVWAGNPKEFNENRNVTVQNIGQAVSLGSSSMYYMIPGTVYTYSSQYSNTLPQYNANSQTNSDTIEISIPSNNQTPAGPEQAAKSDYLIMHTVALPNKRTNSPFQYFKELLQIYNMILLDSVGSEIADMTCLIKFKLVFQQDGNAPVTLCLRLFCKQNIFCIQVTDLQSKNIDACKLSANWQWEILKGFKGDVINKVLQNSNKISPEVFQKTNYFVSLLSTIVVSKDLC